MSTGRSGGPAIQTKALRIPPHARRRGRPVRDPRHFPRPCTRWPCTRCPLHKVPPAQGAPCTRCPLHKVPCTRPAQGACTRCLAPFCGESVWILDSQGSECRRVVRNADGRGSFQLMFRCAWHPSSHTLLRSTLLRSRSISAKRRSMPSSNLALRSRIFGLTPSSGMTHRRLGVMKKHRICRFSRLIEKLPFVLPSSCFAFTFSYFTQCL